MAAQRRRAVEHLKSRRVSERRACRLTGLSRASAWYRPRGQGEERARLRALDERYPRYGCSTLHAMLRAEGLVRNAKRTPRIYREQGLAGAQAEPAREAEPPAARAPRARGS